MSDPRSSEGDEYKKNEPDRSRRDSTHDVCPEEIEQGEKNHHNGTDYLELSGGEQGAGQGADKISKTRCV